MMHALEGTTETSVIPVKHGGPSKNAGGQSIERNREAATAAVPEFTRRFFADPKIETALAGFVRAQLTRQPTPPIKQ